MNPKRRVEGWYDPEEKEFTQPVMLGPKVFTCPGCGTNWKVAPKKSNNGRYWDYEGVCGDVNCGTKWVNRYHAFRRPENVAEATGADSELNFDPSE